MNKKTISILFCFLISHSLMGEEFKEYGLFADKSSNPQQIEPLETLLPLKINSKSRIAYIGNTLLDRAQHFGHFEAFLQQRFPNNELTVRNFAWSADEIDLMPRPDNFASVDQHLFHHRTDIIFAAFGFNESFAGEEKIPEFKSRLQNYLKHTKSNRKFIGSFGC